MFRPALTSRGAAKIDIADQGYRETKKVEKHCTKERLTSKTTFEACIFFSYVTFGLILLLGLAKLQ